MGVVLLQPGKGHARHNHPGTEEILYVVSGQGKQMIDIEGETWEPLSAAGDLVHIPPYFPRPAVFHETSATWSDSYPRVTEQKGPLESLVLKDGRG